MQRAPRVLLAAASLALVTFLVVVDLGRTSPGEISLPHARAEGLEERRCDACHGGGERTLHEACGACHASVAEGVAAGEGLHGTLESPSDCGACHAEHLGARHELVGERAWRLAGFAQREDYAHEGLDFGLVGRHADLACVECHALADAGPVLDGAARFHGASQDCADCHEDPHEGRMTRGCASCHGQERPFEDVAGFVHAARFPLEGVHGAASCSDCHTPGGPYEVEALGGADAPPDRGCADCHESPHSAPFLDALANLEASSGSCADCHGLAAPFSSFDEVATRRLHGASGFELAAPHAEAGCAECHAPDSLTLPITPRLAEDCAACHASPHGEEFATGPFMGFDCRACHAREAFVPATFDAASHLRTGFLLEGGHGEARCADCHGVAPGQSLGQVAFSEVPRACAGCHADAHEGRLARSEGHARGEDCATCHGTTSFAAGAAEDFEHGRWTGFVLDGAHAAAGCEACHRRSPHADALGRRFGRVAQLFGEPTDACATCHATVHVGALGESGEDCAACHGTASFAQVEREEFDHAARTGVALRGAHAAARCEACHAPREAPDAAGRVFGLVGETFGASHGRCADCHEDPHGGRFDGLGGPRLVEGRAGCARCHDEESFRGGARGRFDHGLWTGFSLEDGHAQLSCEACHSSPTSQSLGRTLGRACAACHDDPHVGQFGAAEARCDRCHASAQSFSELVFDHDRDARFVLDEEHRELACAACHKPWPLAGGGTAVRYKPLGTSCADCHLGEAPR